MKAGYWIVGGSILAAAGVWAFVRWSSPSARRARGLGGGGGNAISARNQQAAGGTAATIFHEPDLEPVNVDLSTLGSVGV